MATTPLMTKAMRKRAVSEHCRKAGRVGGWRRAERLTPKQRSESARNAVMARWRRQRKSTTEPLASVAKEA